MKVLPESVISQTLVTGGSVACAPLFGVLLVGVLAVLGAGAGVVAALGAVVEVFVAVLDAAVLADEAAGVGWGVTGGGCTAVAVLVLVVRAAAPGDRGDRRQQQRDALARERGFRRGADRRADGHAEREHPGRERGGTRVEGSAGEP